MDNDPQILPYKVMYVMSMVGFITYVALAAIQTIAESNPALGLNATALAWIDVGLKVLGALGFTAASIRKPPSAQRKGLD